MSSQSSLHPNWLPKACVYWIVTDFVSTWFSQKCVYTYPPLLSHLYSTRCFYICVQFRLQFESDWIIVLANKFIFISLRLSNTFILLINSKYIVLQNAWIAHSIKNKYNLIKKKVCVYMYMYSRMHGFVTGEFSLMFRDSFIFTPNPGKVVNGVFQIFLKNVSCSFLKFLQL